MNLIPILSTVILIATIVTIIIAIGSYLAFKVRDTRSPETTAEPVQKKFFIPYVPEGEEKR